MGAVIPYLRLIIFGVLVLLSIILIVIVTLQPTNTQGLGAIGGNQDTFFAKNKAKTMEGLLKRLTIIFSITIAVLSIFFFILFMPFWFR